MDQYFNYRTGKDILKKVINSETLIGKPFRSKANIVKALNKSELQPSSIRNGPIWPQFKKNEYILELLREYDRLVMQSALVKVRTDIVKDSIGRNCKTETIIEIIK